MKPFWKSTTLQGSIVSALGLVVQLFKLPVLAEEISSAISAIMVLIGIGMSVYGRIKTKGEKIGLK